MTKLLEYAVAWFGKATVGASIRLGVAVGTAALVLLLGAVLLANLFRTEIWIVKPRQPVYEDVMAHVSLPGSRSASGALVGVVDLRPIPEDGQRLLRTPIESEPGAYLGMATYNVRGRMISKTAAILTEGKSKRFKIKFEESDVR